MFQNFVLLGLTALFCSKLEGVLLNIVRIYMETTIPGAY